ncbi:MAG: 4a-hydroxytetrahydrobiopterin dehydratase [Nitrososphaerota archaeon]|nr:4a-hydroxytetrahydrobiopterin dehydratase [Nitrososphaerota archaeon]
MDDSGYRRLTRSEIASKLKRRRYWKVVDGKLRCDLSFKSFEDAIAFIVRASLEVTKLNHHPEWSNVYNRVRIELVTHDVNGVSNYDFILAEKIDRILKEFKVS